MVFTLKRWKPTAGSSIRQHLLQRVKYCGAGNLKCLHTDQECCCVDRDDVCCCDVIAHAQFDSGNSYFDAYVVETGETLPMWVDPTFPGDWCAAFTADVNLSRYFNHNYDSCGTPADCCQSGRTFQFTMWCPSEIPEENCLHLQGRPTNAQEALYCSVAGDTSPTSCACGDGSLTDPFYANFGPFTFTSNPLTSPDKFCECGDITIQVTQSRAIPPSAVFNVPKDDTPKKNPYADSLPEDVKNWLSG